METVQNVFVAPSVFIFSRDDDVSFIFCSPPHQTRRGIRTRMPCGRISVRKRNVLVSDIFYRRRNRERSADAARRYGHLSQTACLFFRSAVGVPGRTSVVFSFLCHRCGMCKYEWLYFKLRNYRRKRRPVFE